MSIHHILLATLAHASPLNANKPEYDCSIQLDRFSLFHVAPVWIVLLAETPYLGERLLGAIEIYAEWPNALSLFMKKDNICNPINQLLKDHKTGIDQSFRFAL